MSVLTSLGSRVSIESASHSGRSGNPKVVGLNTDLAFSSLGRVKPMTFKLMLVVSLLGTQHYQDRVRTGWLSVKIMRLSRIASHDAGSLMS